MQNLFIFLSLLSTPATAGEFLVSATADSVPSGPDVGGLNWVRVFNNVEDGGWWLAHHWDPGTGPGYNVAPMSEGLAVDMRSRIRLAEYPDVKDHGVERCPDGSFLHVYSLSVMNDSARAARYTSDWDIIAEGWVEESVPERAHNDMPVICSEHLQGAAFTNHRDMRPTFFEIGPDATVIDTHELPISDHISGGAFKYDEVSDRFVVIANGEPGLTAYLLRRDLTLDRRVRFEPIPSLDRHFWPQGLMRVGDYWLLVFLGEAYGGMYLAGDGDVYVAALNNDFETVDTIKVSNNIEGEVGSARPSFARHGNQLLVAWDKEFSPYTSVVTLNLSRFGLESDDTGFTPGSGSGSSADDESPCAPEDDGWSDEPEDEPESPTPEGNSADDGSETESEDGSNSEEDPGSEYPPSDEIEGEDSRDEYDEAEYLLGDTADDWEEDDAEDGYAASDDPCETKGCGCSNAPQPPDAGWLLLLAGLVGLQRRRR